jgi:hypothetical protein
MNGSIWQVRVLIHNLTSTQIMIKLRLLQLTTVMTFLSVSLGSVVLSQFSLSQGFQIGAIANAQQASQKRVRWTPNRQMGSVRNTLSGGRRGQARASCNSGNSAQPMDLSLLVPNTSKGLYTTASNPTFFWQVNTPQASSVQFILSSPESAEPLYTQALSIQQSGVAQVKLPTSVTLQSGIKYRWTVLLACQNGAEIAARSFVEKIAAEPSSQTDSFEQAIASAQAGIWYDALNALMTAYQQDPTNTALKTELRSLLSQAGNSALRNVEIGAHPIQDG